MVKKISHVWGLEIGQSAIKALRCHIEDDQVVADSFDFVEYPKILSQPDSEPDVLLADALEQFMSRNDLKGCKVLISVPGQQGLAKFFKPPPVEVKKIPDIVRYEAKQQIPFDLNDVIWDYQQMAGANIEDGYALESEVGLFAMKREAVIRALKPFQKAEIEADVIQLSPVAVYNMIAYDRFSERLADGNFDPDHPPKSTLILSIGTDATDLIVTNGFRIWQRSMPIGGNHFTRQLSKELKLTFAKAEHLKRNAMQSDDPKLVFQAMRPVFNDMHTEIQRSIGFFRQLNKKATIESLLLLGNTAKLPGLQAYLAKSLSMDVEVLEKFQRLQGGEVVGAPTFKENQPSFGVVYGLCLQGLQRGPMKTNLLPREIVIDRLVDSKKPWIAVAAASLLLGLAVNYAFVYGAYTKVAPTLWQNAETQVTQLKRDSDQNIQEDETQKNKVLLLNAIGEEVSSNAERRVIWLELLTAINAALDRTDEQDRLSPMDLPYSQRTDFHITQIDSKFLDDITKYLSPAFMKKYNDEAKTRKGMVGGNVNEAPKSVDGSEIPADTPELADGGWVLKLEGYHYHNGIMGDEKSDFVRKKLIHFFETGTVKMPGPTGEPVDFTFKELGIAYPILVTEATTTTEKIGNVAFEQVTGLRHSGTSNAITSSTPGGTTPKPLKLSDIKDDKGRVVPPFFDVTTAKFTVQFVWKERTLAQRLAWRNDPRYDAQKIPPKELQAAIKTTEN